MGPPRFARRDPSAPAAIVRARRALRLGAFDDAPVGGDAICVQTPLRRPTTRLTPPTQKTGHPPQ